MLETRGSTEAPPTRWSHLCAGGLRPHGGTLTFLTASEDEELWLCASGASSMAQTLLRN